MLNTLTLKNENEKIKTFKVKKLHKYYFNGLKLKS